MGNDAWRTLAEQQAGLITRAQLNGLGVDRWAVRNRVASERWVERTSTVISTTTGTLTREQLMWLGVLHAGGASIVGDLTAAELAGLRNWHREEVTILVPKNTHFDDDVPGVRFVRTRRPLTAFRSKASDLPTCLLEPAILHFAAYQRSHRTADGVLAAAVQQQLTSAAELLSWVGRMRPLRGAPRFRATLGDIAGGSHSVAELDVLRMCRRHGLARPARQTKRRDASGKVRFTDCEWQLPSGAVVVLEVDGAFHMEAEHWEDDIARQRALSSPDRLLVRCTARELRDEPGRVVDDLIRLGVPRAA